MKTCINIFLFLLCLLTIRGNSQIIPFGTSQDSIFVYGEDSIKYNISYYKPANYDSINSPIILGIHGLGGNGIGHINVLIAIADRRKALIIAPTMHGPYMYGYESVTYGNSCTRLYWLPSAMKAIYKRALYRENRQSANVYLTGFSAGGQFTTRYMLIRQGHPDSIPIRMAVSVSPHSYTFCTDSLNGIAMPYYCGLLDDTVFQLNCANTIVDTLVYGFTCHEQVIQYYNENYGVLIGTADTNSNSMWCTAAQGDNRYERAKNFYNFSGTNAITRGTTLQWKYDSVVGVAHAGYDMYNTKRNVTDSSTIAESLLFDTPWHPVPSLAPLASFTADTTIVTLPNATVQFYNNSINAASYIWDFGDTITNTLVNPSHTYLYPDTFTVKLTATSGTGCGNEMIKRNYIIVKNASGVNQLANGNGQLAIYPNPTTGKFEIKIDSKHPDSHREAVDKIEIYNVIGEKIYSTSNIQQQTPNKIDLSSEPTGIYFIELKTVKRNYHGKVVKE